MTNRQIWTTLAVVLLLCSGGAALNWQFFRERIHLFDREVSQEQRKAENVGAKPLPTATIVLELKNPERNCTELSGGSLDGDKLLVYVRNRCKADVQFVQVFWRGKTIDGTTVVSGRSYLEPHDLEAGERREFEEKITADPRIVTVIVSTDYNR